MRYGFLSSCFEGVALKRLRAVEVNPRKSNQHELNGSEPLKQLLALQAFNERPATFIWLGGENEGISEDAWVTWYDSRENQSHRAAEWRLYYPTNAVMELAQAGDLLVVARRPGNQLMLIIAPNGTTANQLAWLFGIRDELEELGEDFRLQEIDKDREIDFVTGYILDDLGIEFEGPKTARLDALILERYPDEFPSTRELLGFVRERITDSNSAQDDPDAALLTWMNEEKTLFRHIERREVSNRLEKGFVGRSLPSREPDADVEGFLQYSLRVQNRRKTRARFALGHYLSAIFDTRELRYTRNVQNENWSHPNFLFPGQNEYFDTSFPIERLTMLSAKTVSKDHWQQVLSEAMRILDKHLLTLEPGISEKQTDQMRISRLQLVVPRGIHETYGVDQRKWLMSLSEFLELVAERQETL